MKQAFFLMTLLMIVNVFPMSPEKTNDKIMLVEDDFPGWNRKQAIIINGTSISGSTSLTNFPFLVTLDHLNDEVVNGGVNSAKNGGGDLRFSSDPEGNTPLSVEVVEFVTSTDINNRKCQIWVKVPSVSASSDTTIYIWYNNPGASQVAVGSAYGSNSVWSDYEAVWHMENDPSLLGPQILDATGNGHNLTSAGAMTSSDVINGAIGSAISFDGSNDRFALATNAIINNGNYTVSAYVNFTGANSYNAILANTSPWSGLWVNNGSSGRVVFYDGDAQEFSNSGTVPTNTTIKYDFVASNGDLQHYFNGIGDATQSQALTNCNFAFIGSENTSAGFFSGWMDEIRLSSLSRSTSWLLTENNNQTNPSGFATKGSSSDTSDAGNPGDGGGSVTESYWTESGSDIHYNTGNVGIGTINIGTWQLAVGGKVRAEEIKVETDWADYVFSKNYKLPTLEEVENHINSKGHLINIPSAKQVQAEGIFLGEMNKLLLEKIEEITLYTIQQQKELESQNMIINQLFIRLAEVESKIEISDKR